MLLHKLASANLKPWSAVKSLCRNNMLYSAADAQPLVITDPTCWCSVTIREVVCPDYVEVGF